MPRWTEQTKQKQRELIEQQRPWTRSCGPKSRYGKLVASQNARKHRRRFQLVKCDMAQEPESCLPALETVPECHSNVTVQKTRDIQIGDRVTYVGDYQPTFDICQGLSLKVVGFDEAAGAIALGGRAIAIACQTAGGKLIWIYAKDLQQCPDGHRKHENGNQS